VLRSPVAAPASLNCTNLTERHKPALTRREARLKTLL
jgi:hypothetical protein